MRPHPEISRLQSPRFAFLQRHLELTTLSVASPAEDERRSEPPILSPLPQAYSVPPQFILGIWRSPLTIRT
jgi:hypothetical protein